MPATSVTLSTTAVASVGIGSAPTDSPVTPVSCTFLVVAAPNVGSAEHCTQLVGLVSRIRNGLSGVKFARPT